MSYQKITKYQDVNQTGGTKANRRYKKQSDEHKTPTDNTKADKQYKKPTDGVVNRNNSETTQHQAGQLATVQNNRQTNRKTHNEQYNRKTANTV